MKKVGIITELNPNAINYGNVLQAYALNKYITLNYNDLVVETLLVNHIIMKKVTTKNPLIYLIKIKQKVLAIKNSFEKKHDFQKRQQLFLEFVKGINYKKIKDWDELCKNDYDYIIVGSDIVWKQGMGIINRVKFLNFTGEKIFKKIAYAASFGNDCIPKENKKYLKKYLDEFSNISVREKSSVTLLNNLGINNVFHVCDPTILISNSDWENVEKSCDINCKYIFTYLLGKDKYQRKIITNIAKVKKLKIVNIPYSNGHYDSVDDDFADIKIHNCSPENWIWLIHNAEYIFTDSFHGTAFSVIFQKKFVVLKRKNNINNRMKDFIHFIDEDDKLLFLNENVSIDNLKWDYSKINKKIYDLRKKSIEYLNNSLK